MTYKVKSLLYFICFVAATVLYYHVEDETISTEYTEKAELVKADLEQISSTDLDLEEIQ